MLRDGKGLTAGVVAVVAVVVGAVALLGLTWWSDSGRALPVVAYWAVVPPLAVAAMVLAGARSVRRTVLGRRAARPADGLRSVRILALCQAAGLTGGVVLGWYAALAIVGRAQLGLEGLTSSAAAALATAVSGVLLAAAGILGQSWCRLDVPPTGPDDTGLAR